LRQIAPNCANLLRNHLFSKGFDGRRCGAIAPQLRHNCAKIVAINCF